MALSRKYNIIITIATLCVVALIVFLSIRIYDKLNSEAEGSQFTNIIDKSRIFYLPVFSPPTTTAPLMPSPAPAINNPVRVERNFVILSNYENQLI